MWQTDEDQEEINQFKFEMFVISGEEMKGSYKGAQ